MSKNLRYTLDSDLNDVLSATRAMAQERGLTDAFAVELFRLERHIDEALAWREPTAVEMARSEAADLRDRLLRQD